MGWEKKKGREEGEMEGEVEWPLRGGRGGGGKRKRRNEREKRGRNEENGGEKLEQGRRLAKAGPTSPADTVLP